MGSIYIKVASISYSSDPPPATYSYNTSRILIMPIFVNMSGDNCEIWRNSQSLKVKQASENTNHSIVEKRSS